MSLDPYLWVGPLVRLLPPEAAHDLTIALLRAGFVPRRRAPADAALRLRLWGLDFEHPFGLAAGFDKNAEVVLPMFNQGFAFVEVGTVTPRPQPGNPKPRLFRLPKDGAVINRMGFNNAGVARAAENLAALCSNAKQRKKRRAGVVIGNVGKNRDAKEPLFDYVTCARALAPYTDLVALNVSSPNTPGLRDLQARQPLSELLVAVKQALKEESASRSPRREEDAAAGGALEPPAPRPLLLKIAPDLTEAQTLDIAEVALATGVDGLIISNTTVARPESLRGHHAREGGGLSGRPLLAPSTKLLGEIYRLTQGRIPLIGVGGVFSAEDAYAKVRAGASLIELYTALIYHGPGLLLRMAEGLVQLLRRDGFSCLSEAVGADQR